MWAIAFLAGLVVMLGGSVNRWLDEEAQAQRKFRARQMALSGLAIGMNPDVKAGEKLLGSGSKDTEGYEVVLGDESGKINPNYWIAQNNRDIFIQLFDSWGAKPRETDVAIDSLIDWIDADDFRSLNGAERGEYEAAGRAGFPANRPLRSVREMDAVLGLSDVLALHEGWPDLFTVWHNGKINVQYAGAEVLASVARLNERQIRSLLELRAGADRVDGSADDVKFESIDRVAALVGADALQARALGNFFDVSGSVRRIESTGWCAGTKHTIVVIAVAQGGQILNWDER